MLPEDRLDMLLTPVPGERSRPVDRNDELGPLVDVAHSLSRFGQVSPTPEFATALHVELLERAAVLRDQRAFATEQTLPGIAAGSDDVTIPLAISSAARRPRSASRGSRSRVFWQGIAAAVVLLACGGTLSVAAFARPGSPLYALRQLEQRVGVPGVASDADLARQQLSAADSALSALTTVVTQHGSDASYARALATLRKDEASAESAVNAVTTSDHAKLLAQLQSLQARERDGLRSALPQLGWDNRVATTLALGDLGDTIPRITSALANLAPGNGARAVWHIEIHGSGFLPGASLVVNGQQIGTVISETQQTLIATVPADALQEPLHTIGIVNPDGSAAEYDQSGSRNGNGDHPTPGAVTTPSPNGSHDGGHGGPPTPGVSR